MSPPFSVEEYQTRLTSVRGAMLTRNLDALVIGDPSNMNWLTGFDAWSMYVPQIILVTHDKEPIWMGRSMDAGAVALTTYLKPESVMPYPETHIQQANVHAMELVAGYISDLGLTGRRIGYESDTYFFSPKALSCLQAGVADAHWVDADRLVNWCRVIKSNAEIAVMRQAARLVEGAMSVACEHIAPGVRQCDLMARIVAKQVGGNEEFGGDLTALSPLILAGKAATTAHPMWTDEKFVQGQTVALELGGTRKRYNAGLARTVQLGKGPQAVFDTASAVEEGLNAVLETLKPGVLAGDAHRAWQAVLDKHGLVKDSRIGYSIGVGYSPDWGEHTVSLRGDDTTVLAPNMTLHVMLGMWMDDWGMELSETVAITDNGVECLTQFARDVQVVN
ncbi:ectoine hydrolase DoeA [Chromatiales bacterium (ex Bugula neritina AB1)]|nr:ectoine hydrolase DoeA [Chromatiales bacterium (ex Bugula neritina AB1)]